MASNDGGRWPPGVTPKHPKQQDVKRPWLAYAYVAQEWQAFAAAGAFLFWTRDGIANMFPFLAPIAGFIGPVILLVTGLAYRDERRWGREQFAALAKYNAEQKKLYEKAWSRFHATRPLALIGNARVPLRRATSELAKSRRGHGTVILGVDTTESRELVSAGRSESVVVVAPSQMGKTTGIAVPSILIHPGSVLAATIKGDVLRETALARGHRGPCYLFDPLGTVRDDEIPEGANVQRISWSPLGGVQNWDTARLVAASLVGAAGQLAGGGSAEYWPKAAQRLVAPLLLAAALHEDGSMNHVSRWINRRDYDSAFAILSHVAASPSHPQSFGASLAIEALTSLAVDQGPEHTAGIFGMAATALDIYNGEAIQATANVHNFDVAAFVRSGNQTLYICAPQVDQKLTAPLNVALIDAIYRATEAFSREDPFELSSRPPLLACLDEVRNIAPTQHLMSYMSAGLGQGFQTMVFLQFRAQAKAVWGDEGEAIFDAATTKVIMGGMSDPGAMEALSMLIGDTMRMYRSTGTSSSTSTGDSWTESTTSSPSGGSRGRSTGGSRSETSGRNDSLTERKERLMSPADLAATPRGQARVVRVRSLEEVDAGVPSSILVDLVPSYGEPWASAVARLTAAPAAPEVAQLPSPHPRLGVSVEALRAAFTNGTMSQPAIENVKRGSSAAHGSSNGARATATDTQSVGGPRIAFSPQPVEDGEEF